MDPSPFDFADADVILRTSDGISLKVHTLILKYSSPFFSDLFSLPQPASDNKGPASVDISENGKIMHTLLMLVYPMEDPQIDALSLLSDVLWAAQKYGMDQAIQSLRRLLVSPEFVQKTPLLVYAVASRYGLEAEMKVASKESLGTNLMAAPLAEELKYMTAYDYQRLLNLHHKRGVEARKLILWESQSTDNPGRPTSCQRCISHSRSVPRWWTIFSIHAKAVLYDTPTTGRIFTMSFLRDIGRDVDCQECPTSLLRSYWRVAEIKEAIDALPATV